jgi:SAM-dependent methyltransferase
MIRALANILKVPEGGRVLDPFIGSGTTALECQLLGIAGVGLDISPLWVGVSSAMVLSLGVLEYVGRLAGVGVGGKDLFSGAPDPARGNAAVRTFYQVADLIAASDALRRRRDRDKAREKNLRRMLASVEAYAGVRDALGLAPGRWEIREGDALELPFESWTFDAVITSPPYSIALDYMANDAAALETLGAEVDLLRGRCLGLKGKHRERVARYHQDLARAVQEMARVLKPGGGLALVLGDASVDAEVLPTTRLASEAAVAAGLKPGPAIDKVIFGLYSIMLREKILLFSKPS